MTGKDEARPVYGGTAFLVKNGDRFFLFNETGRPDHREAVAEGVRGGRAGRSCWSRPAPRSAATVVWSHPAFAEQVRLRPQRQGDRLRVAGEVNRRPRISDRNREQGGHQGSASQPSSRQSAGRKGRTNSNSPGLGQLLLDGRRRGVLQRLRHLPDEQPGEQLAHATAGGRRRRGAAGRRLRWRGRPGPSSPRRRDPP